MNDPRRARWGGLLSPLFGEAWELERRRHRRHLLTWLAALTAVGALSAGLVLGGRSRGHGAQPAAMSSRLTIHGPVGSGLLARSGEYSSLAVIGGRLELWGPSAELSEPSASVGRCNVAQVNPTSLDLSSVRHGSCADPALYEERVLTDSVYTEGGPTGGIDAVRISTVSAGGGYHIGPVVLRYEQCSDCQMSLTYGDGSLWIYSPVPLLPGSDRQVSAAGELLRISEVTGRVAQRWAMPALVRALLVTNADGLWIAPSLFSGEPEHVRPAERSEYESLYRVGPGMRAPRREYRIGPGGARWMVAAGSTVSLQVARGAASEQVRLSGVDAVPVSSVDQGTAGAQCLNMGEGPMTVHSAKAGGIFCLGTDTTGDVWNYSSSGAAGRRVAKLALPRFSGPDPSAVLGDEFFVLQPPDFSYTGGRYIGDGAGVLYRVKVR